MTKLKLDPSYLLDLMMGLVAIAGSLWIIYN